MISVKTVTERMATSVSIPATNAGASDTKFKARQNETLKSIISTNALAEANIVSAPHLDSGQSKDQDTQIAMYLYFIDIGFWRLIRKQPDRKIALLIHNVRKFC